VKDGVSRAAAPVPTPGKEDVSTWTRQRRRTTLSQCDDRVTVLGLVSAKMAKRVSLPRQEDEDRWSRQETTRLNLDRIVVNESGGEEETEDV
jgi:hypothetical protein